MEQQFNENKFINAVLFFARNTNADSLGAIKLNKLLYFSDFLHFKAYGRSILGDRYIKWPFGPVPSTANNIIYSLLSGNAKSALGVNLASRLESKIKVQKDRLNGKKLHKIIALEDPNLSFFSESELEIMEGVATQCRRLKLSGTELSRLTHLPGTPWSKTKANQEIDYRLILDDSDDSVSVDYVDFWEKEADDLKELLASPPKNEVCS